MQNTTPHERLKAALNCLPTPPPKPPTPPQDFAITQERQGAADALADVYDNSGLAKVGGVRICCGQSHMRCVILQAISNERATGAEALCPGLIQT